MFLFFKQKTRYEMRMSDWSSDVCSSDLWQMHVTGLPRVWFAVLMGRRLDVHELARDQDDIDFMVEQVDRFWHDHVETGTPPPTDSHDATLQTGRTSWREKVCTDVSIS